MCILKVTKTLVVDTEKGRAQIKTREIANFLIYQN